MISPEKSAVQVLEAEFLASANTLDRIPPPAFAEVAFAGRSNVGKSSLINSLVQRRKLVRTSSTPGCTRGINLFRIGLRGDVTLDLVDLPGYGYAKRSRAERKSWGPLIEGFLSQRPGLRGVVLIIDVRRGVEEEDQQLLDYLAHIGRDVVLVGTKLDKLASSKRKAAVAELRKSTGLPVIGYSSETSEGREALWRRILGIAGINLEAPGTDPA